MKRFKYNLLTFKRQINSFLAQRKQLARTSILFERIERLKQNTFSLHNLRFIFLYYSIEKELTLIYSY